MDIAIYVFSGFVLGAVLAGAAAWFVVIKKTVNEKDHIGEELQAFRETAVRLETEKRALQERIEQGKDDLKKMETQFENLSNKI